ncbi:MAG TPA: SDR family oxidoreductase [Geminicoccaceae bacterium]|nr:SDR family oxidoreductase [Geminicoccaceae bacterium]
MRFVGRTVLITGGGRGIGRATALRFAREGAAVAVLDLDLGPAQDVVREIAALGRTGVALAGDVAVAADGVAAVAGAERALGPLDVLVNNAAWTTKATLAATGPADWERELAVTLTGAWLMARAVLPGMVARGRGAIVSVASVNGLVALGNPAYSAAKAGLLNLTRSLALEYGPRGIRANAVSPGSVRTEHPSWQVRLERDPALFEKLARWYPVGRVGVPDDVAAAIAFLAADEAGFVNGANLVVDGGLTAGMAPFAAELAAGGE